jgi:hypothetical protein
MASENKGNPFVDLFFFVLQEVISVNFTGLWKPTLYNFIIISPFHQYLSPSSCHPKHCFKSIPFSQAIRIKWICSIVETTKQRLDLHHHLKKWGYNDKVIESGFSCLTNIITVLLFPIAAICRSTWHRHEEKKPWYTIYIVLIVIHMKIWI